MSRFIKRNDRFQSKLFPETLDDYIEGKFCQGD